MKALRLVAAAAAMALMLAGCRPDLLRFGNRPGCYGYVDAYSASPPYSAPIQAISARMAVLWADGKEVFVLGGADGTLHVISRSGETGIQRINNTPLSPILDLVTDYDLVASSFGIGQSTIAYVFSFQVGPPVNPLAVVPRLGSPKWHPSDLLLAGKYFPDGYEHATNVVGIFDLRGPDPVLVETYELEYTAIKKIGGWSGTGDVIAILQDSELGLVPYYLFTQDGLLERSLFATGNHSCVIDGQWAPDGSIFAFSGVNEALAGWDIFLETVPSSRAEHGSLVNLTNSPQEDEIGAAWSENGTQIAYSKAYLDQSGHLRQELFLIVLDNDTQRPVQLTDVPGELATNPMWILDHELAYLSWSPSNRGWSLNSVSVSQSDRGPNRIMEIPPSWFD